MKDKKGSKVVIALLVIIIIMLIGYISYDKFLKNDKKNIAKEDVQEMAKEQNKNDEQESDDEDIKDDKVESPEKENKNYVETRMCEGTYSGVGAVLLSMDGKTTDGTIIINLKQNGVYELKKELNGSNVAYDSGEFTIIENTLLLKTAPDICNSEFEDCSAKYSHYLSISDDCSYISFGYGSYFFDSDFILNRIN